MERVTSITVTFYPDPDVLLTQLMSLHPEQLKLVVDNGTPDGVWAQIAAAISRVPRLEVIRLGENLGLAAGINAGARWIRDNAPSTYVLLLDQDSEPVVGSIARLLYSFESMLGKGVRIGAVGADLRDAATGREEGFHIISKGLWRRFFPENEELVQCASLNGSGTVLPLDLLLSLGGLESSFFIDHVDTEWSFRLTSKGYFMYGVPGARILHRMGERSARIWFFGWRPWPVRSPLRHRYLFRNAVSLLKRSYVPFEWKWLSAVKLGATMLIFALTGPDRLDQLRSMTLGILDGLKGRSGRL